MEEIANNLNGEKMINYISREYYFSRCYFVFSKMFRYFSVNSKNDLLVISIILMLERKNEHQRKNK